VRERARAVERRARRASTARLEGRTRRACPYAPAVVYMKQCVPSAAHRATFLKQTLRARPGAAAACGFLFREKKEGDSRPPFQLRDEG